MSDVLNTVVNGIQTKADKYKNYRGQRRRTTVIIDVTEAPWVRRPEYLRQIRARVWDMAGSLDEIFFIINGTVGAALQAV